MPSMSLCHPFGHLRGHLRASVVGNAKATGKRGSKLEALEFTTNMKTLSGVMTNLMMRREVSVCLSVCLSV